MFPRSRTLLFESSADDLKEVKHVRPTENLNRVQQPLGSCMHQFERRSPVRAMLATATQSWIASSAHEEAVERLDVFVPL
jgi:hypothetical protein